MHALVYRQFGSPPQLALEDIAEPPLGPGEVRIRIAATGLNPNDRLALDGKHHLKPTLPLIPGGEIAGIVREIGLGVRDLAPGDRVMAMTQGGFGGLAEEAVVPAGSVAPIGDAIPFQQAACLLSGLGAAFDTMVLTARAQAGDWVLVFGANGGVGSAAIDIGRFLGCRTIAVVRSAEAAARVEGADAVLDASVQDIAAEVMRLTGERGADIVIDPVGADCVRKALPCTAFAGRIVIVGCASGEPARLNLSRLLLSGLSVSGSNLALRAEHDPDAFRSGCARLVRAVESGLLHPRRTDLVELSDAAGALAALPSRTGKFVVTMPDFLAAA